MIRAILKVFGIVRRARHERVVLHVPQSEAPACIRESARCVLTAHGMWLVDKHGELITDERFEQLLRELGNNSVQGLYSIDQNPENA